MTRFLLWTLVATALVGVQSATAAQFAVGSCKPNLTSFPTISAAVAAVPAGSTVLVCPGTYPEQVVITQPLTLQGIISGNSGRAVITVPGQAVGAPQLAVNSQSAVFFAPVAGQVVVQNVSPLGAVNLSDITVDGSGGVVSCAPGPVLIGIFYTQASGTLNHVTTRSQLSNGCGVGMAFESGLSPQETIDLKNSSVHEADFGIITFDRANPQGLMAKVDSNSVTDFSSRGMWLLDNNTIAARNFVARAPEGINSQGVGVLTTNNTIAEINPGSGQGSGSAIVINGGGVAHGNRISASTLGVNFPPFVAPGPSFVEFNTIMNVQKAVELQCNNATVSFNTINDAVVAIDQLGPADVIASDNFFNVGAITLPCGL